MRGSEAASTEKQWWERSGGAGRTHEEREALWPLSPEERYIRIDVETDGPVPGMHSMLSIGAAAYNAWGQRVGKFSANLETLPDAITDDRTMAWWESQGDAWTRARERTKDPKTVMEDFHLFALGDGPRRSGPTGDGDVSRRLRRDVGYLVPPRIHKRRSVPAPLHRFEDTRNAAPGGRVRRGSKAQHAGDLVLRAPAQHVAVEDAVEQGELFVQIVQALREEHLRSSMTGQDVVS